MARRYGQGIVVGAWVDVKQSELAFGPNQPIKCAHVVEVHGDVVTIDATGSPDSTISNRFSGVPKAACILTKW